MTRRWMLAWFIAFVVLAIAHERACADETISTGHAAAWLGSAASLDLVAFGHAQQHNPHVREWSALGQTPEGRIGTKGLFVVSGSVGVHELSKKHKGWARVVLGILVGAQVVQAVSNWRK